MNKGNVRYPSPNRSTHPLSKPKEDMPTVNCIFVNKETYCSWIYSLLDNFFNGPLPIS